MSSTASSDIQQVLADILGHAPRPHRQTVSDFTAAVIAVEEDLRFLRSTMQAVLRQSVVPAVIVVADCTGAVAQPVQSSFEVQGSETNDARSVSVRIVRSKGARSFGDAVSKALQYAHLDASIRYLWLLHDDSRPADDRCLEYLLDAQSYTSSASVFGAKQLDWDGGSLHHVGYYAGRHRLESLVVDGEPDQEQYDGRSDVFAVSLAGALVPLSALKDRGGIDPWFGTYGEAADFCRRICLGGGRVVVVPRARVAHRRARLEGIRSHDGRAVDEDDPENTTMARMQAGQRYYYTDRPVALWPVLWIMSVLGSLWAAVSRLFAKSPYEAWCAICQPWAFFASVPSALRARHILTSHGTVPLGKLSSVVADRRQIAQWRDRRDALRNQRHTVLLSSLERAHLHARALRRWAGAAAMSIACFAFIGVSYASVLKGAVAGSSLYSSHLPATGATFGQLLQAATTSWVFGSAVGVAAPPTPWLLVWLGASLLTWGNVAAATTLMFFASSALTALSFWSLAGVFTRSDAVRIVSGLLWFSFAVSLGLYRSANLAMLTVMVFLPAAFAFVFRAVGMYHTEDRVRPHSSVQAAACAALCFVPVVASEPQLIIALIVVFVAFIVFVRGHRTMLLLIPVPAAFAVAPTFVNVIRYAHEGLWRQLFGDILVPSSAMNGRPSSLSLVQVAERAYGVTGLPGSLSWSFSGVLLRAMMVVLLLLVVLAVVSLFLPFALRASRMMWVVAVAGACTALVSARVVVAVDSQGRVAGSVLPGFSLVMLGMLSCVCLVAGGAVKRYVPLRTSEGESSMHALCAQIESSGEGSHPRLIAVGRSLLVCALALAVCVCLALGAVQKGSGSVEISRSGLPMVASDYLKDNTDHRVLAISARTRTYVEYTVMRTDRGDLIDASAAQRAQDVSGLTAVANRTLASASSRLLANADSRAIEDIGKLGFGGIYVRVDSQDAASRESSEELVTNINASDGVQSVVSNDSGTYYRLTAVGVGSQSIDTSWQRSIQSSAWRYVWLWSAGVIGVLYCLVALPRGRRTIREEA